MSAISSGEIEMRPIVVVFPDESERKKVELPEEVEVLIGDPTNPETLERAHVREASYVILALEDDSKSVFTTLMVKRLSKAKVFVEALCGETSRKLRFRARGGGRHRQPHHGRRRLRHLRSGAGRPVGHPLRRGHEAPPRRGLLPSGLLPGKTRPQPGTGREDSRRIQTDRHKARLFQWKKVMVLPHRPCRRGVGLIPAKTASQGCGFAIFPDIRHLCPPLHWKEKYITLRLFTPMKGSCSG